MVPLSRYILYSILYDSLCNIIKYVSTFTHDLQILLAQLDLWTHTLNRFKSTAATSSMWTSSLQHDIYACICVHLPTSRCFPFFAISPRVLHFNFPFKKNVIAHNKTEDSSLRVLLAYGQNPSNAQSQLNKKYKRWHGIQFKCTKQTKPNGVSVMLATQGTLAQSVCVYANTIKPVAHTIYIYVLRYRPCRRWFIIIMKNSMLCRQRWWYRSIWTTCLFATERKEL